MKRRDAIRNTALFIGAASFGSASILMQSCKPALDESWKPSVFSKDHVGLLAEIAETILPKTDTPGAKDAQCERYLDEYASLFMEDKDRNYFKKAIDTVGNTSKKVLSKDFMSATSEERGKVLQAMIDDLATGPDSPKEHFEYLRKMTNMAFFTSEVGATQVLDNMPIPGEYLGDIPLSATKGKVYS